MKIYTCLAALIFVPLCSISQATLKSETYQDSARRVRFVHSLLRDHKKSGRWVYSELINCEGRSMEILETKYIYDVVFKEKHEKLKEHYRDPTGRFVWVVSINLLQDNHFNNCGYEHVLKGRKVDTSIVINLLKYSSRSILDKYFKTDKVLKSKYKSMLPELIAALYMRNIKVITEDERKIYYEIFE